jgi:hypothetical protein
MGARRSNRTCRPVPDPNQTALACAVECNSEREDAYQLVAGVYPHGAGGDAGSNGVCHKNRLQDCGGVIVEESGWRWTHCRVPVHAKATQQDGEGERADHAYCLHGRSPVRQALAQAMAGRGSVLAFCVFARHVSAPVEGWWFLIRTVRRWGSVDGWAGPGAAGPGASRCGVGARNMSDAARRNKTQIQDHEEKTL